ncbi:MAG TPA: hypothetical protein VMR86_16345 [Myxococcota bacterium]|nr:hypothetical protein [Myxococcota bacterium]
MTRLFLLGLVGVWIATPAFAGNVLAVQHGKTLKLTFDDFAVHVTITSVPLLATDIMTGFIGVRPDDVDTTVNGSAANAQFIGVESVIVKAGDSLNEVHFVKVGIAKNLSFTGGKGSGDTVSFGDCEIGGNASFKAGPNGISLEGAFSEVGGNLQVKGSAAEDDVVVTVYVSHAMKVGLGDGENHSQLSGTVGGSFSLKTGKAPDTHTLMSLSVAKSVSIDAGDGGNATFFSGVSAPKVSYKSSNGDDYVNFSGSGVAGDASFSLGNGDNQAAFSNSSLKNLSVKAGAGDDSVFFDGATPTGQFKPSLGKGTNSITTM